MTSAPAQALEERDTVPARGRHRHRPARRKARRVMLAAAAGVAGLAIAGGGYVVMERSGVRAVAEDGKVHAVAPAAPAASHAPGTAEPTAADSGLPTVIPGLGAKTRAKIPAASRQVLVASGVSKSSATTVVTLWSRTADGHWKPGAAWAAHNALHGWTTEHHAGDLHSPIGVFTLSDAGGFDANPGSKLPYHRSSKFQAGGVGFDGEPLDQAFDYVIAIDYNRVPGHSPLDGSQPLGPSRGGGIWVHVDHGGPTHGCVSIAAAHMVELLRTLLPTDHPVIVMGDRASLAT